MSRPTVVKLGLWNMLADGLSTGEFMSKGGDAKCCVWDARKHKVAAVIREMLGTLDIVGVVENDHYHWLLAELQKTGNVEGVHYLDVDAKKGIKSTPTHKFKKPTADTFASEGAAEMAAVYGVEASAEYRVDDGLTLYYNVDKVTPIDAQPLRVANTYAVQRFRAVGGEEFSIVIGHLSSGDTAKDEAKRFQQVVDMTQDTRVHSGTNVVIMMDSNYGKYYQQFGEKTADEELASKGWANVIAEDGNECFKMRHAQGGQPKKFGDMMFDSIDKICTKRGVEASEMQLNLTSFKRALTLPGQHEAVASLRTDAVRREALKEACTEYKWSDDNSEIEARQVEGIIQLDLLQQLYPNMQAPSDHPPVAASVALS
jgi:hypothetical protein